ncbi:peptidase MA family metallohydrolase [Gordonia phthalatica]|uniref:Peptidase MA-like domain-containing protein n=1 Tax=Gordonia phthalatica TaxID=1136941 RepID=A0A0N9NA28_9ACTN|nr:hypothetical protein [Gordonia phthalatica]ALG85172.1 hypothetical protein ACH46_12645 [Gordonia phthalatica]
MRTRRTAVAVPVLVVALLAAPLTACGSSDESASATSSTVSTTPLNPYEQQRYDGVTALLDQLTATLRGGDRAGLAELIDDAATPEFRRHLEAVAGDFVGTAQKITGSRTPEPSPAPSSETTSPGRSAPTSTKPKPPTSTRTAPAPTARTVNAGPLKLKEFRFRVAPQTGAEQLLDPAFSARLEAQGATDTWVTPVDIEYALGGTSAPGLNEPTVTLHRSYTFARYGDDWKIVGDGGSAPDATAQSDENPKAPELGPWDFPGLAATDVKTAGGTSTVLFYKGAEKTAATAATILSGAVDEVSHFWGDDWVRRVGMISTSTPDQFAGLTKTAPGDTSAAAAATVFTMIDKQNKQVIGQRIVLTPAARSLSAPALAVVVRHELVHVAARLVTADGAPLWLTEGVPEYVGRKGTYRDFVDAAPELAAAVAAKDVPKALPSDGSFSVSSDAARIAYQSAWSFAAFVGEKFGDEKLKDMYLKVAKGGDTATQDAAIKDALGVDKARVIADWQSWLRKQVRR